MTEQPSHTYRIGDHVKLRINSHGYSERVWCKVVGDGFAVIDNVPLNPNFMVGDEISFSADGVLDHIAKDRT